METVAKFINILLDIILGGGIIGVMVLVWKAAAWATRMEVAVKTISENHLAHIYERLGAIEEKLHGYNQAGNNRGN